MNHVQTSTKQLPLVKGWPLVGSLFDLLHDPLYFFFKQYEELGPIYQVKVLGRTLTVLGGPEANSLLTKQNDSLDNRAIWAPILGDIGAERGLSGAEGETHTRLRRLVKNSFGPETIYENIPTMLALSREALASHRDGAIVEAMPLMQRLVATQLGFLTNGRMPEEYFPDIMTYWNAIVSVFLAEQRSPRYLQRARVARARARVEEFGRAMIERRRRIPHEDREPMNLIDNMLGAQEAEPGFLTDEDVLFNAMLPYFAGIDTAAGTASFLLYELLTHPSLLEQVEAEVAALFADEGPTKTKLKQMPTLKAALQETLRLYPIAGLLKRRLHEDIDFDGHALKAGQLLFVATGSPHLSASFYTEPQRFDHERFLPPRNEHRQHKGIFAPYGAGPHTCIGAGLAEVQIMVSVSVFLHEVCLELADPSYRLQTKLDPALAPKNFRIRLTRPP